MYKNHVNVMEDEVIRLSNTLELLNEGGEISNIDAVFKSYCLVSLVFYDFSSFVILILRTRITTHTQDIHPNPKYLGDLLLPL